MARVNEPPERPQPGTDHAPDHGHGHGSGRPSDPGIHADGAVEADASVRPARPNDLAAVGQAQAAVWRAAYGSVLSPEVLEHLDGPAFARVWRDSLASPPSERHLLLVALAGAQVVGLAAVGPSADPDAGGDTGEVLVLGVHPDARRSGHGSRLLNAATVALREMEMTHVSTWVMSGDDDVRGFLAGAGLRPDGAWRDRVVDADQRTVRELRLTAAIPPA